MNVNKILFVSNEVKYTYFYDLLNNPQAAQFF
jgi:hypothetical protein